LNVNLGSLQYQATSSYINERKVYDQPNGGGLTSAYDYSYDQYGTLISKPTTITLPAIRQAKYAAWLLSPAGNPARRTILCVLIPVS
jgi:hypothetical protein